MDAAEYQFRTAAFGGFQKQDVMNYIEAAAKEHSEKVEALQKELDQLRQGREELEKRSAGEEERSAALSAENQRLTEELAARSKALEEARAEAEQKDRRLADAETVIAQLREKLRVTEPAAAAYESIKDRTAGVELEAHHRAQIIEDQAREKARVTAQALEQWLSKVQAGYDRLRTDLDATIAHAAGELERVNKSLCGLTTEFDEHDAVLEKLVEEYKNSSGPHPPKPLPLDGE